jgi:hypothetical protein
VFGAEVGLTRLLAPFHLFLFTGSCLLVTSPLRAAWQSGMPAVVKKFRTFAATALSLALITTMISFFLQYASPLVFWKQVELTGQLVSGSRLFETIYIHQVLSVLVTNLIFMAPLLLSLKRWRPPAGTFTFVFTLVALFDAELTQFSRVAVVAAFAAGGLVADLLIRELRPNPERRAAIRLVAVFTPAVMWSAVYLVTGMVYAISWPLELWMGAVVLATMSGFMLSLLMFPAVVPSGAWKSELALLGRRASDKAGESDAATGGEGDGEGPARADRPLRTRTVKATQHRRDMPTSVRRRNAHGTSTSTAARSGQRTTGSR